MASPTRAAAVRAFSTLCLPTSSILTRALPLGEVLAIGTVARDCLESAIESAVSTQD